MKLLYEIMKCSMSERSVRSLAVAALCEIYVTTRRHQLTADAVSF